MKSVTKIILIAAAVMMSLFIISCGEENKENKQLQLPQVNNPNYFGNNGFDCNHLPATQLSATQLPAIQPGQLSGNYPSVGAFLGGNPNAIVRQGDRCFYASDLHGMYGQYYQNMGYYQTPWNLFPSSPYADFQVYGGLGQSSGSFQYSNTTNMSSQWTGIGDMFGFPYARKPRDQFYINFDLWW